MRPDGRTIRLTRESFPDRPARDTAVTRALLSRVANGDEPETLRLQRPAPLVAFGPHDRVAAGYRSAISAARARGFDAIERLAGGRAAVFHEHTIAFAWVQPVSEPTTGIRERFAEMSAIVVDALRSLGVEARIGEVAGEYCPGEWSVSARGERKIMGVGQRLVKGAAHVGGVVVVDGSDRVRDVLVPVYEALALGWRPETAGSVADEIGSDAGTYAAVEAAIVAAFASRHELVERSIDAEVHSLADRYEAAHLCPPEEPA